MKLILMLSVMLVILCSCNSTTVERLHQVTSPDHLIDAIMVAEKSGGAAGSVAYEVYLAEHENKAKLSNQNLVFEGAGLKDASLEWREQRTLVISYSEGRILSLKQNPQIQVKRKIEQFTVLTQKKDKS